MAGNCSVRYGVDDSHGLHPDRSPEPAIADTYKMILRPIINKLAESTGWH